MSRWTHVAGIIRVDGLASMPEPEWTKLFKVAYFDQPESFDTCNMPYGTEGSIEYSVHTNSDPHCMARYVVTFWGDLRDYGLKGEIYEIENWFRRIVKKLDLVRMGQLQVIDSNNENSCLMIIQGDNKVRTLQFKEGKL